MFSFECDLDRHVVIRHNEIHAKGTVHHDTMMVYHENGVMRADYFDNEGHLIHYRCSPIDSGVVMNSDGPGPKFRYTYTLNGSRLHGKFEIGDATGAFHTYLEGDASRVQTQK